MRTSYLIVIILALCGLSICSASAQESDTVEVYYPEWISSIYADFGIPLSYFADNLDKGGLGVGGEVLYNIKYRQPVWAGVGVHSFTFDNSSLGYAEIIDGELVNFDETTASRLFMAHFIVRFQPEIDFFIQPYLQAAVGMHWFFTNTKIEDVDFDEIVDRTKNNSDSVLGYGLHAGILIGPARSPYKGDFRIGYFKNASVEYMRYNPNLGDIDSYPIDFFETRVSVVDILGIQAAFVYLF